MTIKTGAELRQERQELIDSRGPVVQEMGEMRSKAKESGEGFDAETQAKWDRMAEDVTAMDAEERNLTTLIKLSEQEFDNLPEARAAVPGRSDISGDEAPSGADQAELRTKLERQQFNRWMATGQAGSEMRSGIGYEEALNSLTPEERANNTLSGPAGDFIIPETWAPNIVEGMKAYGGILGISDVISTAGGEALHLPTHNGTSEVGRIIGEAQPTQEQDMAFGEVVMNAFMYSSDVVKISLQLQRDNTYGLEGQITEALSERLGRITARHFAVGVGGATEPQGVFTAATSGNTTAAANSIGYLDMLGLKHSVDPAYRARGARWVFNDTTLLALKSLLDSTGLPLWNPNVAGSEAGTFDGDGYTIDQASPDIATGDKAVLYGDFSKYKIRRAGGITLFRFNELYMRNYQVAFDAFMRLDGRYVDAGGGAIKALTIT